VDAAAAVAAAAPDFFWLLAGAVFPGFLAAAALDAVFAAFVGSFAVVSRSGVAAFFTFFASFVLFVSFALFVALAPPACFAVLAGSAAFAKPSAPFSSICS
jgi:hypothetical protein